MTDDLRWHDGKWWHVGVWHDCGTPGAAMVGQACEGRDELTEDEKARLVLFWRRVGKERGYYVHPMRRFSQMLADEKRVAQKWDKKV